MPLNKIDARRIKDKMNNMYLIVLNYITNVK